MSELDWDQPFLGEVADVIDPHPSHRAPAEMEGGIPFVGIGDLSTSGEVLASSARKVSPAVLIEHKARYTVAPGDIAYGRVATVGKVMRFGEITEPFALSPTMALIKPTAIAANYLAHFLQSKPWDDESAKLLTGTTRSSLGIQLLRKIRISCPRLPEEQRVIGKVLDTLDTAIHQTEAIIAKLKAVKQGLLNDLLTRGIDANGELRPPQSEAPHLYKPSPLGWIPKEWDVDAIENVLDRIIDYRGKTPEKTESGVPLITAKNVRLGYIDPEPREFIAIENFERWMSRGIPQQGDVLFTTEAPLGNVAQIETNDRLAFAQRMIILQTGSRLVNSFLKYLMLGKPFRTRLFALGSGSTVEGIQQSTFRKILVAIPGSLVEQKSIVEMLINTDSKINYESSYVGKLKQTRAGLMDDLLTGRVRVTPLLAEAAQQPGSA